MGEEETVAGDYVVGSKSVERRIGFKSVDSSEDAVVVGIDGEA